MIIHNLDGFRLTLHQEYIEVNFHNASHFDEASFLQALQLKYEHYGEKAVGIWVLRTDIAATHSFDPMILVTYKKVLEENARWVVVISKELSDLKDLQYVQQFTTIPCNFVSTATEADTWVRKLNEL
ncbi:hypothetical protein SAMN05216480_101394 [Pustulibacterium marinum]|uniref:SpoIIAA-like n=1 Tax=Pustulibacterium marinum TaxID=1224947 RepID=A0A1I7EXN5_9FLAO|nr:hypothetical protein [Pustulibacterium marinum]SFU28692.1 hypothetical protein SAMN05216480_101394 [Pustulibacterium marinum]